MKIKAILTILMCLFIYLMYPVKTEASWTEGHYEIYPGDVYGELEIYNDVTLDIFGGDIYQLYTFDTTLTNFYDGTIDYLWSRENSIVSIYDGVINMLGLRENSIVNLYGGHVATFTAHPSEFAILKLYAYDVTYHTSGGYWNDGWIEGKYILYDQPFRFDIYGDDSFSHVNIVPEPATMMLLGLGSLLVIRKRK